MNSKTHQDLYDLIAKNDFEQCFDVLETIIQSEAPLLLVELVMLRRRQESLRKDQRSGTLSNEDFRVEESKLARDLLYLIQQLPSDEEVSSATRTTTAKGKLLHDIPARFPLNRLTKCVIRIADTEAALLQDYQAGEDTIIEEVPIKKVMAVELIDIEDGENFEIKPLNSTAQKLLSGEASQWVYYVKALTPGDHLLVLRISTVKMIDGVERPKEVLFERPVRVEAEVEPQSSKGERNWQLTHLSIAQVAEVVQKPPTIAAEAPSKVAPSSSPEKNRSSTEIPRPTMSPPVVAPAPTTRSIPWAKIATALLLVVVAGWWISDLDDSNTIRVTDEIDSPSGAKIDTATHLRKYYAESKPRHEFRDETAIVAVEDELRPDLMIGTYRSPSGEKLKIAFVQGELYLSGSRYESPRMINTDRLLLTADGVEDAYKFIMGEEGLIKGFVSISDSEEVWLKIEE